MRGAAAGAEGIERGEGGAAREEGGGVEEGDLGVELGEGRGGEALVVAGQAQPAHARQRLCGRQGRGGERGGCSDKMCVYERAFCYVRTSLRLRRSSVAVNAPWKGYIIILIIYYDRFILPILHAPWKEYMMVLMIYYDHFILPRCTEDRTDKTMIYMIIFSFGCTLEGVVVVGVVERQPALRRHEVQAGTQERQTEREGDVSGSFYGRERAKSLMKRWFECAAHSRFEPQVGERHVDLRHPYTRYQHLIQY